jgi:hypothetical protein
MPDVGQSETSMDGSTEGRTPPLIVADSEQPAEALSAFIAQELEAWGFAVKRVGDRTITTQGITVMTG